MEYLEDILITADLQIKSMINDYIYLSLETKDNLTYFKTSYFIPDVFIKDEMCMKNIGMKWNETSIIKIPKDIHLLGKIWLTVNIPYFQIIEKLTSTTQTTTNNATINQMIFDNHTTYLIIYNNINYLIPDLFLKYPELNYASFQFKFNQVKEYFIDLTGVNIEDDTNIIFFSFNMNGYYSHDIIPTLLNLVDSYDKLTLQKLLNNYDAYKMNLLTQNSFDNYITKIVEDDLINEYQNINKFDTTIDSSYYNFMGTEFGVLYNNKIVNNSDVTLVNNYIINNSINTVNSIDTISQDAIIKTPLVYEYLITNLNPSFEQTYTFYKKITTIATDSIYEYTLTDADLDSGTINSDYPTYILDMTAFVLPFTLTTSMTITTIDNIPVTYTILGTTHTLTIDDSAPTILDNIKLVINTNNNTLNDPNINVKYPDVNSNSEWTDNLLINLSKLDYNKQLEVLLFYEFKKNYYSKESIINNELLTFSSSVNSIKTFWIALKVVQDRFDKQNDLIGYNDDDYLTAIETLTNNYQYIVAIENYPQDVFNVYSVVVNKLYNTLKKKYFTEFSFLRFFYNKINSYIYQRNKDISKNPTLPDYKGLLFYFNVDLTYYIDRNIIKNYLLELFYMDSYIAYIPSSGYSLTLSREDINFYLDSANNNFSDISTYFHELKYVNRYQLLESFYTLLNVGNKIAINKNYMNYLYYKSNLVEFQLEISNLNAFLNVTSYSIDDTYVYLYYDTSVYDNNDIVNNISNFYVNETIKLSVPMMYESSTLPYTTANVVIYDKSSLFNAFINYNQVNVNIVSETIIIMKYTKYNIDTTYKCSVDISTTPPTLINPDLPTNYNDYDLIEMISILLPTTNFTISDSDCNNKIANTFPTIELLTSSSIYTSYSSLLVGANTFKVTINDIDYPVNIISLSGGILYLYVYNNNIFNATSIDFTIFTNTNLPNLYDYTSLNNTTCETNDYMIQKPMILPFVDLSLGTTQLEQNTNFFILANVPRMKVFNNYSSSVYLDTAIVLNVYNLYSNQLLRNGNNLYSAYYESNLLANNNNIDNIEDIVTHVYTGMYDDIYGSVVNVIENAQNQYINSYTEILDYISSGSKFGITLKNIENYAELLNEYFMISNITKIKLSLYDATLIDFDNNTPLATGIWNFTNNSNNNIKPDYDFISVLAHKYNNSTMKIVNSLWSYYVPYVKINPMVIKYLDRYSSYATNMNNNLISNKSALILVNNKNFPQEFNEEYQMRDKYYHLATDTNKFIITSATLNLDNMDPTNKSMYISKATINGKTVQTDGTSLYTTEDIEPYKFKPYYKETKYDNMNIYYKLVGAVRFESNAVINTLTIPDYIITDNLTVIKTFNYENIKTFDENFYGINYNSKELDIATSYTTISSGDINTLPFSFYLYKFSFTGSDPFTSGTKYLVSINEQTGYLIKTSGIISLLIGKNFILKLDVNIRYLDASAYSNSTIFSYVYNNTPISFTANYVFTEFTLNSIGNYNKYFNSGLGITTTNYIMFDSDDNLLHQVYGYSLVTILDKFLINVSTSTSLHLYAITSAATYLPPIKITKSSITYFSTYEEIIKNVDNKNYWLFLKNTSNSYEFQIKDIDTQTFSNGNYLVYFCNNTDRPIIYSQPDTFRFGNPTFDGSFNYNPFTNKLTMISYKSPEHPNYNYINTFTYTYKGNTITVNALTEYKEPQDPLQPLNKQDTYLYPQRTYFRTNIRYNNGTTAYNRPIMITNELPNYDYQYYYTNYEVPGGLTFIGDSLIYLTKAQYQALTVDTVITNIKSLNTPTSWITTDLTSFSNFIKVEKKLDGSGNKIFQFKIVPYQLIPFDTYNLILLMTPSKKHIYLWLYIDSKPSGTPTLDPHKFIDTTYNIPMTQPLYYSSYAANRWKLEKPPSGSAIYATFEYTDLIYFDNNTSYIEIADYSFNIIDVGGGTTGVRSINDTYTNFYESQATFYGGNAYDPTVQNYNISRMNEWSYIKNTTINNQFINDLTLQKFNLFIFKSNLDRYYFNVKKNNNITGIELESPLETGDYDVYIYSYEPIYMNVPTTYNIDGTTAYIYITRYKMQRNEVIRIGYYYVQIVKWSVYYNCYIGNVLFSSDYVPMSAGYYSLGIFTNYLTRNTFLKGTNYNYHEYVFASSVDNSRIEVGDYYIENDELKQYSNDTYTIGSPPDHIFKLPYGNYMSLLTLAYFGTTQTYYYDGFLFDLKPGYTIVFNDTSIGLPPTSSGGYGYGRYPVMIDTVANNTFTFNPVLATFPFGENYMYVPYQPFDIQTITITNNVISGMTFNGWIQVVRAVDTSVDPKIRTYSGGIYLPYYTPIVKVVGGTISNSHVYTGTFTAKIIDKEVIYRNIKHDFNNPLINVYDNTNCANKIYLYASTSDTNVYFYYSTSSVFNDAIDNNTLQFCYYQSIIINDIWYHVIKIDKTNHRLYIDTLSSANIFNNGELYEVLISAANVNNINLISNNHKLRTSHAIDYPSISYTYDTPGRLTSLFKGNDNNKYIFNFKDATIGPCSDPYYYIPKNLSCPGLLNTVNYINNNNYNLERYDYYEDFIPLWEDLIIQWYDGSQHDLGYNFYQIPLDATAPASTLMINYNAPNGGNITYNLDKHPRYAYSATSLPIPRIQIVNNILLQEITIDGTIYQHFISISITNYHIKITNTCFFQNIETSSFYLNNVIPCNITKYNNIILLPPNYHFYREINQTDRKIINLTYIVKLEQDGPPTFTNNKWKYHCKHLLSAQYSSIDKVIFEKMEIFVNNNSATYEFDHDEYFYLYIDNFEEILTNFTYNSSASVDSIIPDTTTIKNEYSSLTNDELAIITGINNDYNLRFSNVLYLSKNISTLLSFLDQSSANINFGDIDDTNYIGKSNRITYSAIKTDNTYKIDTLYSVLDIDDIPTLYSILTNLSIVKPLYYILEPEISTSVPALELLINDEGLSIISILNETKAWDDWTLITTRYNTKLEPYLNNYDLIYDGTSFTTLASTSYFTNNEITKMKAFMTLMYNNNDAQDILAELYLVEQYLLEQIIFYTTQRYFWNDIINILKKVVANYNGTYNWTITNNILCIENEFIDYPEHFELDITGNTYYRLNYLPIDYTINYTYLTTKMKISRDPSIIDTNIGYIINASEDYNLYGTNMNNVIDTLINYGTRINKIKSPLPIYYKYMDSVKYYIAKLFFEIFNTNDYKFNNLTTFNRTTNFDSNYQYYGKYYDYYFNKRYYGINGFNQYNELNLLANNIDTLYVEGNIINTLYSSAFNENLINLLTTNNIFKYNINIKNEGYESTDLIKASNTYSVDIKDNYNHLVDPTIDNVYINTNSLEFSTTEMVQPTDISILSSEPYTFTKFDYGLVMVATTNTSTLNNTYTITSNNIPVLFIEENSSYNYDISYNTTIYKSQILSYTNSSPDSTINLRANDNRYNYIIISNIMYEAIYVQTIGDEDEYTISAYTSPFEISVEYDFIIFQSASKATNKVVIITSTYNSSVNRTYITFSANYTNDFVYITINNIVYQIVNPSSGVYYISGNITITTKIIYTVFKTFNISLVSTNYNYISELTLDRNINQNDNHTYNQIDTNLPMTFNIDNATINKVEILTSNKVRLTYNIIDSSKSIGSILYHKYRLNESIPYALSTITPQDKYYYEIDNTYKIAITDSISFDMSNFIITTYDKTTSVTTTVETVQQVRDYETITSSVVISTTTNTVTTNEITSILPVDGTTTTSSSVSTTITNQWIDKGCHWDGGYSGELYPGGADPVTHEYFVRTINNTFTNGITSVAQAITLAEAANANVFGIQAGTALFTNNTLTTTWPYRYDRYDVSLGTPSTCSTLGDSWSNHVYTLKKTSNIVTTTITTTISHTVINTPIVFVFDIYSILNNIITFNIDKYVLIDDLNDTDMIIVKTYDIENEIVSYVGTTMIINIPANLVNANSVYSLNNGTTYAITSIVFSEYIIITTTAGITTTNLKLIQTITDANHSVIQNKNNQEYTIVTSNDSNYDNKSPYFIPIVECLDANLKEFDAKYFYKFEYIGPFTFDDFIFLNYNDIFVKGIIIMIQDTTAIIGTNTYINCNILPFTLTIYSNDLSESQSIDLLNQYYPYTMGTLLEQTNNTTYKILLPKDSIFEYNINDNTTTNKMIMTFRYSQMNLNNITYPLVGFNKVPSSISSTTTNTTNYIDINWIEYIGVKLFKSIELLIDDIIVEKIDYNIYAIFGYYILNEFKRGEFNNLTKIRQNADGSFYYNIPIPLILTQYLPISSMGRSTIKIKFVLEKLENLISNITSNFTKNVIPSIDFNYSFMTVDNNVLNKFKKSELLLTTFYYYQNYLLNKETEYNHISLLNRTLEIFFITKTKNDTPNYTTSIDRDNWYNIYLSNNPNDGYIFNTVDAEISANSYRYQVLKNHLIIKNYDTRFAMYLDTKYLNHINENLNNTSLKFSNKLTVLSLYFQNVYKNRTIITLTEIIDKLNIYINGKELLPELPSTYHGNVISYYKGMSLPFGYYMYGFNYHALSTQPNGFLNMKKIRDFLIYSHQTNINNEYKLNICTREYKILKIDNLMGQIL